MRTGSHTSLIVLVVAVVAAVALPSLAAGGRTSYYVSPSGSDTNSGTDDREPLRTIQKALDLAQPGSTVHLAPGTYLQDVRTKRNGTSDAPIKVTGPSSAVVKGGGGSHVVDVNHDYHTLEGFTIDGLHGSSSRASGYREKLLYAQGTETRAGVKGMRVEGMTIKNAAGECVRLRYFARDNVLVGNTIRTCGVADFRFGGGDKNGEGIYIGTADDQLKDGRNPTSDRDESRGNLVRSNLIDTQGAECVNIKEASTGNTIEGNTCTGQRDPNSGGLNVQGNDNVLRDNEVYGNVGAGIRLGGATRTDGIGNDVYDNVLRDNETAGLKVMASPQGKVCGNTFSGNGGGDVIGTYRAEVDADAPCGEGGSGTTSTSTTGTSTPTTTSTTSSTSTTTSSTTSSTSTSTTSTTTTSAPPGETSEPRISEDFSSSAENFTVVRGGSWRVKRGAYLLVGAAAAETGNGNISVHETALSTSFTLTAEARTTGTRNRFNDFSFLFAYQDAGDYCFASFNESNDDETSGIFVVDDGAVRELADITRSISADRTYEVGIEKAGSDVRVLLNGVEVARVDADACRGGGQVGFGTRNDGARFDDLVVR